MAAAPHRGHIICLHGGRAVYVPKGPTLQQTISDALDSFGLSRNTAAHFGFPHADLAIMVEIGSLAFANVRDGAILYLCQGAAGPVFPHELAQQAQAGIGGRPATLAVSGPGDAADVVAPHLRQGRYPENLIARAGAGGTGAARQPLRDGRAAAVTAAQEKENADGEADDGAHDEADSAHAGSDRAPAARRADASAKKRQNQRAPTAGTALVGASTVKRERDDERVANEEEHSSPPARKRPRRNAARAPAS